jgi:N-dimethylarginine dimethylaminohydrolase
MSDLYLMSPPGRDWQLRGRANFRSREAAPVDAAKARKEWLALAEAIEEAGAIVAALPPVAELTGLPYAAECGHVVVSSRDRDRGGWGDDGKQPPPPPPPPPPRFLLPRMFAEHRKGEAAHWAAFAKTIGWDVVDLEVGTWEAQGDVAIFDGATILFFGGRTNREGFERARSHFVNSDGADVIAIEVREPAFHGNMALLPLAAANRVLVCPDVLVGDSLARLVSRFGKERIVHVTEAEIRSYATNGLPVGKTLLAPSLVPTRIRDLVTELGMTVKLLAMDELCGKAGGASRCLVCHVPDLGDATAPKIPKENRLARFAAEIRAE